MLDDMQVKIVSGIMPETGRVLAGMLPADFCFTDFPAGEGMR